jgi:hypothetical protein
MRTVRLVSVCVLTVTLLAGSALAKSESSPARPSGLKAFLLRASEPAVHEFPRTPSFSWRPVRGAVRYEFQLSKSPAFGDASIFWRATAVRSPAVAVPLQLPWMTGQPYAAYARVRAFTSNGVTTWSKPYGFNIRWKQVPRMMPGLPGLSRWTPVEGATSYEVWFTRIGPGSGWTKKVATRTTAVDHREAYTFHDDPTWTGEVRWRVRAVRVVPPSSRVHLNGLPAVSYGPWTKEFVSKNPQVSGALSARMALTAGATSRLNTARSHELTPAFVFSGREAYNVGPSGAYPLYRVYVFSDSDCVNVVFKSAITGSPAYAPRTTGGLKLPASTGKELDDAFVNVLKNGPEGLTFMADLTPVKSTEEASVEAAAEEQTATEGQDPAIDKPGEDPTLTGADPTGATVDLPESGWPNGRYYWTVVPVSVFVVDGSTIEYHDVRHPQDTCNQGSRVAFGKQSTPVVAGQGSPFASGLSPKGRLVAARGGQATFYGKPLVAWLPVQGAVEYEVQWSRSKYPWRTSGSVKTAGTAAQLALNPGSWWYRIRAVNPYLPGKIKAMAWSLPLHVQVAKPRFAIAR